MNERRLRQIFRISLILKGLHAAIECAGGVVLYFVSTATITRWVSALTQEELAEDTHDFVARHFLDAAHHLSVVTEAFYAFYLVSHGLVNALLVVGLLKEKLWAYPASLVVLTGFIGYQIYRYWLGHSFGLLLLTGLDVLLIVLVWHEWRVVRTQLAESSNASRLTTSIGAVIG